MESNELLILWKSQNEKLERSLAINQYLLKDTIKHKAQKALSNLIRLKTFGIISFSLYLSLLIYLLVYSISNYSNASLYFIISIGAITLINLIGFTDYIKHLVITKNINYDGDIMSIQYQLTKLQLSIIKHGRMMCLQFPFFTTFYLSSSWFPQNMNWDYLLFQFLLTGSFIYLSYFLYINHKVENLNKKWFRTLIAGSGGKSVAKAIEFYNELNDFRN
jgi:hypothetical protein